MKGGALPYKHLGVLVLEDGSYFYGKCLPNSSDMTGEICFNTAMTGYQEVISDPSYAKQIIVFSFPHIGNTGVNKDDEESPNAVPNGIILGNLPTKSSNFRSESSFLGYLIRKEVGGLHSVDTRTLIKKIVNSSMPLKGILKKIKAPLKNEEIQQLTLLASQAQALSGSDLTMQTRGNIPYVWEAGEWGLTKKNLLHYKVAILDFGVKANILRSLTSCGIECKVFPQNVSIKELMDENIHGVVLSNGPGDPRTIDKKVMEKIKLLLRENIPILGICLGYQLLALISGAQIKQLRCGHHGINHPVKDLITQKILITSQNHEFVVEEDSLPCNLIPTHRSLFDGTLEGFQIIGKPIIAIQFHPEACPGPHDTKYFFDQFITLMVNHA